MKILHTADWHLGSRLHGHDRTEELFTRVKEICDIAKENHVDILLVAGDVFERRGTALPELTKQLAHILAPYIRDGLHVILLPGNHDEREHFKMMDALLTLEKGQSERIHIVKTREIFTVKGVQFAAIPYPQLEVLQPYLSTHKGNTERNVSLSTSYVDIIRSVMASIDSELPTVFIAHINVAGVTTTSDYEMTYDEDIRLGRGDLPVASNLAYIALGHIHQCQQIEHVIPCYYSGSFERMNLGEKDDEKQVLLLDIPQRGPAKVTPIKLRLTPFYSITTTSSRLDKLEKEYPDIAESFAKIEVVNDDGSDPAAIYRLLNDVCPKHLDVKVTNKANKEEGKPILTSHPKSYTETVKSYLRDYYKNDPDLPLLEKLTTELLLEVENVNSEN